MDSKKIRKASLLRKNKPAKKSAGLHGRLHLSARSAFAVIVFATVLVTSTLYFLNPNRNLLAATFDWVQGSWSGGADTTAVATYTSDRTTWTKYFAKSSNVVAGESSLTLSADSGSISQTTDAEFGTGTGEEDYGAQLYVEDGSLKLKKQEGRACTTDEQCVRGFCTDGVCKDPYKYGYCSVGIYPSDSSVKAWKTTNETCQSPQCTGTLDAGVLASDNNIDFSLYPARDECKNIHGRLPSMTELTCIYNNQTPLGIGLSYNSGAYYLSREELNMTQVKTFYPAVNGQRTASKTSVSYVRCVRDEPPINS